MMNQKSTGLLVLGLVAIASLKPVTAYSEADSGTNIILPAITSRLSSPDEVKKPEITIEEVSRCMGSTSEAKALYDSINQDALVIKRDRIELDASVKSLELVRSDIDREKKLLSEKNKVLETKNGSFKLRSGDIEKRKPSVKTISESKTLNTEIVLFNKDLEGFRKEIASLNTASILLREKIEAYNEKAASSNDEAMRFNATLDKYNVRVKQLNLMVSQYKEKCVGERELVK